MSFLKELGASIGIGNLNVGVDCEKVAHHGEQIRGVATLSGGKVAQIVNGLEVRLVRSWEVWDEERNRYEPRSEVIHRRPAQFQAQVQPGAVYTANFLLDIPVSARLAEHGEWHSVSVLAEISGGVDVGGERAVTLWPYRPIADTLRAIVAGTGWSLHGYQPRKARAGAVRAVLSPSPALAERFDRINLELLLDQSRMQVYATVDLKEGVWKSLTGADEHDYSLSAGDIPAIVASVQGLIHKHAQA